MTSWPTGPVYDPIPTLPPDPAAAPAPSGEEPADLVQIDLIETCDECEHWQCAVAKVGARTILAFIGERYEDLERPQQKHYEAVASQVMASMSEAMIALGVAVETTP